jgi:hypothetical protein
MMAGSSAHANCIARSRPHGPRKSVPDFIYAQPSLIRSSTARSFFIQDTEANNARQSKFLISTEPRARHLQLVTIKTVVFQSIGKINKA